ncbi:hypothetical protein HDK64DRAFT_321617 [Phyllosticta capitalensis]
MVSKLSIVLAVCSVLSGAVALPGAEKLPHYAMPKNAAFTISEETSSLVVPSSGTVFGAILAAQVTVASTPTARVLAVTSKSTSTKSNSSKVTSESRICPQFVCKDYINDCGIRYGGCYDMCGKPTVYTDPGCVSTKMPCNRRLGGPGC